MQEGLFDGLEYEIPKESMGELPPLTPEQWLDIADQMHDEKNWDAMDFCWEKAEKAKLFQELGQIGLSG